MRLGVDIGGAGAKLGLVDDRGRIVARDRVPTGREMSGDALVHFVARAVQALGDPSALTGAGVAAPGMLREDGEGVVNVSNLPLLDDYPLRTRLGEALGLPVTVDNDANAAAMGEYRYGPGRESARMMLVTLGTGIGAGMIVDGAVLRVSCRGLGDPGHVIIAPDGPPCACGGRGCAERLAAVPGIVERAGRYAERRFASFEEVVSAAAGGNERVRAALAESGRLLGAALASLTHVLAPDCILLGGGGMEAAGDFLFPATRDSLFRHVQPYLGRNLHLDRAGLGNDAGLIGAACLAAG